jgi:subtilisin family serine protease
MSHKLNRILQPILYACFLASAAANAQPADPAPAHPFAQSQPIAGRYIVVFKQNVADPAAEAANHARAAGAGAQIHHIYSVALKGFAATLPDAALAGIRNSPAVDYIEQDQTVSLVETTTQNEATWGLDRIDQRVGSLNLQYQYNATGFGVNAFIIDTGIRPDHVEFTGRLSPGYTAITDGRGTTDCNGHGTHVAGTVGGTTWGVAKQVTLTPVRVLDCRGSGTWSGVIAGIDWVANTSQTTQRPAVANMSLGGGKSTSVNAAVAGAVDKRVTMVVAAGNSSADACNYSPSSEPSAITVGASTGIDARASYSNYGSCVDIFAPGSGITSAWNTGSSATNTISGTSMASPHVAGVAALVSETNPTASPSAIAAFLVSTATTDLLASVGTGSPNLLLYSLGTGTPTQPPSTVVAVSSLTGASTLSRNRKTWSATVTATVGDVNNTNAAVANATVNGSFSPGGDTTCVTGASGSCTLTSGAIGSTTTMTVFTVTTVSGSNMTYQDNGVVQISIHKP